MCLSQAALELSPFTDCHITASSVLPYVNSQVNQLFKIQINGTDLKRARNILAEEGNLPHRKRAWSFDGEAALASISAPSVSETFWQTELKQAGAASSPALLPRGKRGRVAVIQRRSARKKSVIY